MLSNDPSVFRRFFALIFDIRIIQTTAKMQQAAPNEYPPISIPLAILSFPYTPFLNLWAKLSDISPCLLSQNMGRYVSRTLGKHT